MAIAVFRTRGLHVSIKHETKKEKIAKKRSIPAQIVFWLFVLGALYLFYAAFSGHTAS